MKEQKLKPGQHVTYHPHSKYAMEITGIIDNIEHGTKGSRVTVIDTRGETKQFWAYKGWIVQNKKHLFKSAMVKGLYRCYVGILEYYEEIDSFNCITPFGTERIYKASNLEKFTL